MAPKTKTVAPPPKTEAPQQVSDLANVPKATALANAAPAWLQEKMKGQSPRGLENADRSDIIFPRLVLGQALSPTVISRVHDVGDVFDNLGGDKLLAKASVGDKQQGLRFIPVMLNKSRMWLPPMDSPGPILCRSFDSITSQLNGKGKDQGGEPTRNCADCVFKEFDDTQPTDKEKKPKCTAFLNVIGVLPEWGNRVIVWSVKSTGIKVARRMISMAAQSKADLWGHAFELRPVDATSGNFKFQNWDFSVAGWATPEEYEAGSALYEQMRGKTVSVDTTDIEREVEPVDEPGSDFP